MLDTYLDYSPENPININYQLDAEPKPPETLLECFEHYNETGHEKPLLDLFLYLKNEIQYLKEVAQVGHNSLLKKKLTKLNKLL